MTVTYEVTDEQRAGADPDELRLAPGVSNQMVPTPLEDGCTVAPIVARTDDGEEVEPDGASG